MKDRHDHRSPGDLADLYAAVHDGTPGDVDFYLRHCGDPCDVLELGCGAGRITLPLALAGHRVTALDVDPDALALLGATLAGAPVSVRESVTPVDADMRTFDLAQRFDRILVPYNTFYCLEDDTAKIACLRRARAHLAPGGRVLLDAYAIDEFHAHGEAIEADPPQDDPPVAEISLRDRSYRVYETTRWDREAQTLEVSYRFQPDDDSQALTQVLDHHYLLTHQVPPLCSRAGLEILALDGDFAGTPLSPDSEHMACVLGLPARIT